MLSNHDVRTDVFQVSRIIDLSTIKTTPALKHGASDSLLPLKTCFKHLTTQQDSSLQEEFKLALKSASMIKVNEHAVWDRSKVTLPVDPEAAWPEEAKSSFDEAKKQFLNLEQFDSTQAHCILNLISHLNRDCARQASDIINENYQINGKTGSFIIAYPIDPSATLMFERNELKFKYLLSTISNGVLDGNKTYIITHGKLKENTTDTYMTSKEYIFQLTLEVEFDCGKFSTDKIVDASYTLSISSKLPNFLYVGPSWALEIKKLEIIHTVLPTQRALDSLQMTTIESGRLLEKIRNSTQDETFLINILSLFNKALKIALIKNQENTLEGFIAQEGYDLINNLFQKDKKGKLNLLNLTRLELESILRKLDEEQILNFLNLLHSPYMSNFLLAIENLKNNPQDYLSQNQLVGEQIFACLINTIYQSIVIFQNSLANIKNDNQSGVKRQTLLSNENSTISFDQPYQFLTNLINNRLKKKNPFHDRLLDSRILSTLNINETPNLKNNQIFNLNARRIEMLIHARSNMDIQIGQILQSISIKHDQARTFSSMMKLYHHAMTNVLLKNRMLDIFSATEDFIEKLKNLQTALQGQEQEPAPTKIVQNINSQPLLTEFKAAHEQFLKNCHAYNFRKFYEELTNLHNKLKTAINNYSDSIDRHRKFTDPTLSVLSKFYAFLNNLTKEYELDLAPELEQLLEITLKTYAPFNLLKQTISELEDIFSPLHAKKINKFKDIMQKVIQPIKDFAFISKDLSIYIGYSIPYILTVIEGFESSLQFIMLKKEIKTMKTDKSSTKVTASHDMPGFFEKNFAPGTLKNKDNPFKDSLIKEELFNRITIFSKNSLTPYLNTVVLHVELPPARTTVKLCADPEKVAVLASKIPLIEGFNTGSVLQFAIGQFLKLYPNAHALLNPYLPLAGIGAGAIGVLVGRASIMKPNKQPGVLVMAWKASTDATIQLVFTLGTAINIYLFYNPDAQRVSNEVFWSKIAVGPLAISAAHALWNLIPCHTKEKVFPPNTRRYIIRASTDIISKTLFYGGTFTISLRNLNVPGNLIYQTTTIIPAFLLSLSHMTRYHQRLNTSMIFLASANLAALLIKELISDQSLKDNKLEIGLLYTQMAFWSFSLLYSTYVLAKYSINFIKEYQGDPTLTVQNLPTSQIPPDAITIQTSDYNLLEETETTTEIMTAKKLILWQYANQFQEHQNNSITSSQSSKNATFNFNV